MKKSIKKSDGNWTKIKKKSIKKSDGNWLKSTTSEVSIQGLFKEHTSSIMSSEWLSHFYTITVSEINTI